MRDVSPMEDQRHLRPQCSLVLEQDNAIAGTTGDGGRSDPIEAARTSDSNDCSPSIPTPDYPTEPAEDINEELQQRLVREQGNATAGTPGGHSDPTETVRTSTPSAEDINEESQQRLVREQGNATAGTPGGSSGPTETARTSTPLAEDINEESQQRLVREQGNATAGTPWRTFGPDRNCPHFDSISRGHK